MTHPSPSIHAYPRAALRGEFGRGAFVFVCSAGLCLMVGPWTLAGAIFGTAALLVAVYLIVVGLRSATVLRVSETGISQQLSPAYPVWLQRIWAKQISWDGLTGLTLHYYATRRDQEEGWLELTLRHGRSAIKIQDSLDRFGDVLTRSRQAAEANGLPLNRATQDNFARLGALRHVPVARHTSLRERP